MKKFFMLSLIALMTVTLSYAKAPKGGIVPCLATCCLGPRVGLEMNEGTKVRSDEWIGLIGNMLVGVNVNPTISGYKAFTGESLNDQREAERLGGPAIKSAGKAADGGFGPLFASCCIGPRIGLEMNDGRGIRGQEYLYLIPLVSVVPAVIECSEAYSGKTMSEVAAAEGLDK